MESSTAILESKNPEEVLAACRAALSQDSSIVRIGRSLPKALAGNGSAVRSYVRATDRLVRDLLRRIHEAQPDLVLLTGSTFLLVDAERRPADYALDVLQLGALEAPFSPWVARLGAEEGAVLFWVSRIREALPRCEPLRLPPGGAVLPHWEGIHRESVLRFIALVQAEIQSRHQFALPLLSVQRLLGLNTTELGRLFGVSRQAATAWLGKGAPASRMPKLQTVLRIAELLRRKLKEDRVPGVVRTGAEAYGGRSILDMIEADRHEEVLERVRDSFDWAATA